MSRRSRRAREGKGAESRAEGREGGAAMREGGAARSETGAARRASGSGRLLGLQILFLIAVFAVTTVIAELAGAANLGVALGIGQVAFALAVVFLLVRR